MFFPTTVLLLAVSGVQASAAIAQRAAPLASRDVAQGWSLQSSSKVDGTTSCGNGAYCPSSLTCNKAANHEVAACCSSSSDCRGDVEGSPACADSSWSLWSGYDGNGFCCEVGMVGAYDISKSVAGVCVAEGSVGSLRSAVETSTGSGSAATTSSDAAASTSASGSSSSSSSVAASTSSAASSSSASSASSASSSSSSVSSAASTSSASESQSSSSASKSESSAESSATKSASSSASKSAATATKTDASGSPTGSATSSATSAAQTGGAEQVKLGMGLVGAAFLAAVAL